MVDLYSGIGVEGKSDPYANIGTESVAPTVPTDNPYDSIGTEDSPGISAARYAADATVGTIEARAKEQFEVAKGGVMAVATGGEEGLIPKKVLGVDIPAAVRRPGNVALAPLQAILGALGVGLSVFAPVNKVFGDLAAWDSRKEANARRIARGGDLRGPSPEEKKLEDADAERARETIGLTAEGLFSAAALMKGYRVPVSKTKKIGAFVAKEEAVDALKASRTAEVKSQMAAETAGVKAGTIPETPTGLPSRSNLPPLTKEAGVSAGTETEVQSAVNAAITDGTFKAKQGEKIFRTVSRAISNGELEIESWPAVREKIMKVGNLTKQEADIALANEYAAGISESGRSLQRLSAIRKQLEKTLDPDALKILNESGALNDTGFDWFMRGARKVESTRRAFLTTQMATAARNGIEQAARFTITGVTDSIEGVLNLAVGVKPKAAFGNIIQDVIALANRVNPKGRAQLAQALDAMPLASARLMHRPVAELTMGKIGNALNKLNSVQEHFYRKLGFEARFRANLNKIGMKFDDMLPDQLTELSLGPKNSPFNKAVENAIDHALELTYARMPKGSESSAVLNFLNHPLATALGNPFPRFWMNSTRMLYEYNPTGALSLFKPSIVRGAASGDFSKAIPVLSKATAGTFLLGAAGAIRESQYGEEQPWYQIRVGEKVIDARPFGATGRYLFLWDAIFHPERLDNTDYFEALFLVGRVAGTGLVLTDLMRGKNKDKAIETAKRWAGKYASGFTVPVRTFKDIIGQNNPDEATVRSTREDPFTGPTRSNIPFASQTLPELRSPLKEGKLQTENPLIRQLSGISARDKSALETEVDRLEIDYRSIYPRTGDAKADRLIIAEMGGFTEDRLLPYIKSERYRRMPEPLKRLALRKMFIGNRRIAAAKAFSKDRNLFLRIKRESKDPDVLEMLSGH